MPVRVIACTVAALATIGAFAAPAAAAGAKPEIARGEYVETFDDDLLLELCGIETTTTLTERWQFTKFADGSQQVHITRTYVTADPRVPIEKGAGTSFYDKAGVQTVTGTPIHLIGRHGTVLIDAGRVTFGNELEVRGPHPSLDLADAELAQYYCP